MALKFKTIYLQNRYNVLSPHCTQIQRHTLFQEATANLDIPCVTFACTMLQLPDSHKVAFKYRTRTKTEERYHHGV